MSCRYVMESVCEAMFITDVTIVTATDTLRAHRSILSAHSPFLAFLLGEQVVIIIITIITLIIIVTRPKPPYGRQGLAGLWGKDTVRQVQFGV